MGYEPPEINHERLLPNVIDEIAQNDPDKVFAEIPLNSKSCGEGFRPITYHDLANSINATAWWLRHNIGPAENFETLAYLGPRDIAFNMLGMGAIKAGYKVLFTSARFNVTAQIKLMDASGCIALLVPALVRLELVDSIVKEYPKLRVFAIPSPQEFLETEVEPFPYHKTYEEARYDPIFVLHTSGTTGFPKPIFWTHSWLANVARIRFTPPPRGFVSTDELHFGKRLLSFLLPAHAAHQISSYLFTCFAGSVYIFPPADVPVSAQLVLDVSKKTRVEVIAAIPPLIEELGISPAICDELKQNGVTAMFYGGAPVSNAAGSAIALNFDLFTHIGTTESGSWITMRKTEHLHDRSIWKYLSFQPQLDLRFVDHGSNVYEAFMDRVKSDNDHDIAPVFQVFPHLEEYKTNDMFSKVQEPGKEYLWVHVGRSDDMQVFHTGAKYHPVAMEKTIIDSNPRLLSQALLIGTGRKHFVLLLELKENVSASMVDEANGGYVEAKKAVILDKIWPAIERVNSLLPFYATIDKGRILFTTLGRPMSRTSKGSLQRKQTVENYEAEIQSVLA